MPFELSTLAKFAIVSAMILLLPRLAERLRLPGVLGYIFAGMVLGPGMVSMLNADQPVVKLFSELGKLLFMFFVGFEIDLDEFSKVRHRAMLFGSLTFGLPFALGIGLGRALGFEWNAAILVGTIIASHTLLAYSILAKSGLVSRESVCVTVGGTIFTDIASMIVLAFVVSFHCVGFSWQFLFTECLELAVYVPLVLFGFSKVARKLIVHFGQTADARILILLVMIVAAAELANFIQLEGIVGAFLVGIAIKRACRGKFVIEQLEVVSHAMFIPAFFLATGFLIDIPLLTRTFVSRPDMILGLIAALVIGKLIAAILTAKIYGYSRAETGLIFSMTLPQMAATLASAVVGYQAVNAQGQRLLDSAFVNAVLVLVVSTCVTGPILTQRYAKQMHRDIPSNDRAGAAPEAASGRGGVVATDGLNLAEQRTPIRYRT